MHKLKTLTFRGWNKPFLIEKKIKLAAYKTLQHKIGHVVFSSLIKLIDK